MPRLTILPILAVIACGGSDTDTDAADSDSDVTNPLPAGIDCVDEAPLTPTLTTDLFFGTVNLVGAGGGREVEGALVELFDHSDPNTPVDSVTTAEDGLYELEAPLGDAGWDGFLSIRATDMNPYTYRGTEPAVVGVENSPDLQNGVTWPNLHNDYGVEALAGRALILFDQKNCSGDWLADAEISVEPSDADTHVIYTRSDGPTDSTVTKRGTTYIFGVMPGEVTVSMSVDGAALVERTFSVEAESVNALVGGPQRTGSR